MTAIRETGFINSRPSLAECLSLLPPLVSDIEKDREESRTQQQDFELMSSHSSHSSQQECLSEKEVLEKVSSKTSHAIDSSRQPPPLMEYSHPKEQQRARQATSPISFPPGSNEASTQQFQTTSPSYLQRTNNANAPTTVSMRSNSVPSQESFHPISSPVRAQERLLRSTVGSQDRMYHHNFTSSRISPSRMETASHCNNIQLPGVMKPSSVRAHDYATVPPYYHPEANQVIPHAENDQMRFMQQGSHQPCPPRHLTDQYGPGNHLQGHPMNIYNDGQICPNVGSHYGPIDSNVQQPGHQDYAGFLNIQHPDYPWMREKKLGKKQQETRRK